MDCDLRYWGIQEGSTHNIRTYQNDSTFSICDLNIYSSTANLGLNLTIPLLKYQLPANVRG